MVVHVVSGIYYSQIANPTDSPRWREVNVLIHRRYTLWASDYLLGNQPILFFLNSLQQLGCRFILWILRDQLAPDCQVQDQFTEFLDAIGRIGKDLKGIREDPGHFSVLAGIGH